MHHTFLGRSGLKVSRICLGTANFGRGESSGSGDWGVVDEAEANRIMDCALDSGINFFDTANVYGGIESRGLTETIIGRWFAQGGNRRERVVLADKVGRVFEKDETDGPNNTPGLSLYKIRRHVEASLHRLQTDHIELIQMHMNDPRTGWDEIWEAFEGLVRSGRADYIGSSNHNAWQIMQAQEHARKRSFMGIVSEQHLYTPLNRLAESELLPMAVSEGIGVTIFSPLFRGLLGVDAFDLNKRPMNAECARLFQRYRTQAEAYSVLCREIGVSEAQLTLAWELSRPGITSVIVAPTCADDLIDAIGCLDIILDDGILRRIDEIFPPVPDPSPYS